MEYITSISAYYEEKAVERPANPETPYRADYDGNTYHLSLGYISEEDSYIPTLDVWQPEFTATGQFGTLLPYAYDNKPVVHVWHVENPGLSVEALCARVTDTVNGGSVYRLQGQGSIINLGPLRHVKEGTDHEQKTVQTGDFL